MIQHLASLLVNTDALGEPISPLHIPFADFPRNKSRSGKYHLDREDVDKHITFSGVDVMRREPRFSICHFPTSYKLNREIENIDWLIKTNISAQLLYARRFGAHHLSRLQALEESTCDMLLALLHQHLLHWLEVMNLAEASFQSALARVRPPVCRCVRGMQVLP